MLTSQIKLQEAFAFYERGQLMQTKTVCEELLLTDPACADALHLLGIIEHQSNQHQLAINLFNRAIAAESNRPAFYANRGNALLALSRFDEAIQNYDQAISIKPDFADVYFNRGNALSALEQIEAAIDSYTQAINTNPHFAQAFSNRGNALQMLKRFSEAVENYDRAISINPNYANAYFNRGNALKGLNQLEKAIENYERAIQFNPDDASIYYHLGNALQALKRFEEAIKNYETATTLNPIFFEAYNNLGVALIELNRLEEAVKSYDSAIKIKPDYTMAYFNRGNALWMLKKLDSSFESYTQGIEGAVRSYDRAIELKPDFADAYAGRGMAWHEINQLSKASADYEKALTLKPDFNYLLGSLIHVNMQLCNWTDFEKNREELLKRIEKNEKCSFGFPLYPLSNSLTMLKKASAVWVNDKYPANHSLGAISKRSRAQKIRVGYFSTDFHFHPVMILLAEVFELHDKNRFELIAFSLGANAHDAMRTRAEKAFDQFIDVRHLSDKAVAQLARDMNVDIAVDLCGGTKNSRTGIFSYRTAPVQVGYLGFPGTMGADYFDYLIADQTIIPETAQQHYLEKIIYLPNSYQPNDSQREISDKVFSRAELGLPETGFIFCCFNSSYKITPQVFDSWMRLLSAVNDSVLLLVADNMAVKQNLKKEVQNRGINPDRLVFAERFAFGDYLARYKTVDLFLNTFPYNAGTTASDALWAGLPVLTWSGETFVSRVTASLLNAIGLPELITESQAHYEAVAIELATQPEKLAAIKTKLAENRLTTPLFDTALFTRHLEEAYTQMMERYYAGLAPDHIYVKS